MTSRCDYARCDDFSFSGQKRGSRRQIIVRMLRSLERFKPVTVSPRHRAWIVRLFLARRGRLLLGSILSKQAMYPARQPDLACLFVLWQVMHFQRAIPCLEPGVITRLVDAFKPLH